MSNRRVNWRVNLPLPVVLDMCKRTAARSWRFFLRVVQSITVRCRGAYAKDGRITDVGNSVLTNSSCRLNAEFEEVVKVLNIGDRIRVLCDDGVVVAEKVSQTQFVLIHCQMTSDSVH